MIYSTEKNIKDLGDKISAEDKSKTEEAIAELRRVLEAGDVQTIKDKTEALKQVSYKIAEELYKQQAAQQGAQGGGPGPDMGMGGMGGGPSAGPGGDDSSGNNNTKSAEDADYEVVDDNK
jgi:molecular chaperone DnaK